MRAKYYKISLRQMKNEKSFVFFFILLIIFSSITTLYIKVIEPVIIEYEKSNAYSLAMRTTENVIKNNISTISYDSVVTEMLDNSGNIIGLKVNTNDLNNIANKITMEIEDGIDSTDSSKIKIPLSLFFNIGVFRGVGIKVKIKTTSTGGTKIECISKFDSTSINQTRHQIILKVKTTYSITAPIYVKGESYEREIILAETIINGNIPNSYANINLGTTNDNVEIPVK